MSTHPYMQVDAFTARPLGGNPCAIVFDADDLSDDALRAIARENNLSETSFVMESRRQADFRVRYFTPVDEVPMAGHPTIATVHALVESGRVPLEDGRASVTLEMNVGPIRVDVETDDELDGDLMRITMSQKKPVFGATHDPDRIMPFFGLTAGDLLHPDRAPLQTVSTGTPQLFVPLRSHDALRAAHLPHEEAAEELRGMDFFSCHLFCLRGVSNRGTTFARHFTRPPGAFEDPFTGSATGGMGAYLWHHKLINEPAFIAEQGHWMHRPGEARVEIVGDADTIESVRVGGTAVTVIRGELEV